MAVPIAYVSGALGPTPSTPLQTTNGEVRWNRHDRKVRMVPDKDAASLLKNNPADFAACVFVEEGYGGLSAEDLRELAATMIPLKDAKGETRETPAVTIESYTPKGGSDPVDVLVLDAKTLKVIALATAPPPAEKQRESAGDAASGTTSGEASATTTGNDEE